MVGNMRKRKKGNKKTKEKVEAFALAMKNVLKQPEKNAQRDPGEKEWACYYCGKEGNFKQDSLRHLSRPWLHDRSPRDRTRGETALRSVGFRGWTLKTIRTEGTQGSPHKLPS